MSELLCEVCGRRPATGVRQSSLPVPYSAAYCDHCTAAGLEPIGIVEATRALLAEDAIDPLDREAEAVVRRSLAFHGRTD